MLPCPMIVTDLIVDQKSWIAAGALFSVPYSANALSAMEIVVTYAGSAMQYTFYYRQTKEVQMMFISQF